MTSTNHLWTSIDEAISTHPGAVALFRMLLVQLILGVTDEQLVAKVQQEQRLRDLCGLRDGEEVPNIVALQAFRLEMQAQGGAFVQSIAGGRTSRPTPLLSVVSPVYRAERFLHEFVRSTIDSLSMVTPQFELILVEDGSDDATWPLIEKECRAERRVRGVKLSRNFGQHQAITAGLEHARGEYVIVMDSDLQDDPTYIPDLYAKALEGHDVVLTRKAERVHSWIKNVFARIFATTLNHLAGGPSADPLVGGYSLLSRRAVNAFLEVRDVHRHYLVLVRWLGFTTAHVPVVHRPRRYGKTSYNLPKLARHAIDGWLSHSNRLLYASVALGFTFLFAAIAGALLVIVLYFLKGFAQGWPSLVVLILVCTATILISLGVLGIYVGKIFDQVRARPLFVVERTVND